MRREQEAGWARSRIAVFLTLTLTITLAGLAEPARGDGDAVMVNPKRIVLEGRERNAVLTLINSSVEPRTYRITFTDIRMDEDGRFIPVDHPEEADSPAEPLIRYAPRQVTLGPGESQTVRLLVRKPPDLAVGEYRSHLEFRALPPVEAGRDPLPSTTRRDGLQVQLRLNVGASVPVIVRHGELSAAAQISEMVLDRSGMQPFLRLRLERSGDRSIYGDIEMFAENEAGGTRQLGSLRGVAVYTTTPFRRLRVPLENLPSGGIVRAVFEERGAGGEGVTAEGALTVR